MDTKKAIICTILFGIVVYAIFVAAILIRKDGVSLFSMISPLICGFWVGDCIEKFYNWLKKTNK